MESLNYSLLRDFDYLFKYVLIGNADVGKSCILAKFTDGVFNDQYVCTIGVDFKIKTLLLNGKKVKLQVWDTAGQERFQPITNCYFKGSHGCICVFDVCSAGSFEKVGMWIKEFREQNDEYRSNVIIVGNKIDKAQERVITMEEALQLARSFVCEYVETSAKTGEGLDKVFLEAGFEWRESGCSMCLGMNPDRVSPGKRCASTSNRNFEGRQGRDARTHLVSPAMAAAAAIAGRLADVREMAG